MLALSRSDLIMRHSVKVEVGSRRLSSSVQAVLLREESGSFRLRAVDAASLEGQSPGEASALSAELPQHTVEKAASNAQIGVTKIQTLDAGNKQGTQPENK